MRDALSRRSALGAVLASAAAGALPAPAGAVPVAPPPDPIFAALAAVEEADRRAACILAETAGDDSAEADARFRVEDRRRGMVEAALRATMPTTLPGLAALVRRDAATASDPESDGLTHLVEAVAGVTAPPGLPASPAWSAVSSPDPIVPAIEAVSRAEAELSAALEELDEEDPVQLRRADEAVDRSSDARNALSRILPTTAAGFRALVRFHAEDVMRLEPQTYGALALRDIVAAMEALLADCDARN